MSAADIVVVVAAAAAVAGLGRLPDTFCPNLTMRRSRSQTQGTPRPLVRRSSEGIPQQGPVMCQA